VSESINEWTGDIHIGDAAETLAAMPESPVHMCMILVAPEMSNTVKLRFRTTTQCASQVSSM